MAAVVAPAADQAAELMQNLSLDSKKKTNDSTEVPKKNSANSGEAPVASLKSGSINRTGTPFVPDYADSSMWYPATAFYYGGYDGSINQWEDYPRYVNNDGVEMPLHGVYGDTYHPGYGYAPYSPYPSPASPVPTMGHDGQLYGTQHYHYPTYYYQQPTPAAALGAPNQPLSSQKEASAVISSEKPSVAADTVKSNSNPFSGGKSSGNHTTSLSSNGSYMRGAVPGGLTSVGYQDIRYGFDGMRSPVPWYDSSALYDGKHRPTASGGSGSSVFGHAGSNLWARNQNINPLPHLMGLHTPRSTPGMASAAPGFMNRYPSSCLYGQCGTAYRTGLGYGPSGYDTRSNSRWSSFVTDCKYKPRGRGNTFYGYGNENSDGLSELNKGPRSDRSKNQKVLGSSVTIAVKGQTPVVNATTVDSTLVPSRDRYNKEDFPESYSDAKFFIIKSYSEDDLHKSVKYNVWASTPNGNKKLDAAYKEAQAKIGGCPVFLLFSVNASGQFVGLAEMVGPVDFDKTVDYWQQDKWNGCFPLKWHIVKDVPNSILKHITLENNDNKSVTNSRDTQEVNLEQGLQLIKLFKEHLSKTCILDDFGFYETRQKLMQERRARVQQIQKQVSSVKPTDVADDKEGGNGNIRLEMPFEVLSLLKKESSPSLSVSSGPKLSEENGITAISESSPLGGSGGPKPSEENSIAASAADAPKLAEPALEKPIIENGIINGS